MNKTAIKNYAVEARKKWIEAIRQQAAVYGCTEDGFLDDAEMTKQLADKGVFLNQSEMSARSSLVNDIKNKGFQNTIEEVAYTWFNRLIAIRFMEVNGYLPSGIRVLSSIGGARLEPDCVREYARLDFVDQDIAGKYAAESEDKLYRYILVEQCSALGKIMPKMFTHIEGYAALLLPERLYIKDGLVHDLTHAISEADFKEEVEIIGWLYQYYISEKKDAVFAALKKNVKITRENIPAATQLFTPDWIVKYMVENSLGRLWLERHPNSGLRERWKYYLDEAEQTPEVAAQLRALVEQNPIHKPEEIRLIDPCMGSGHILVYAFDVLFQIYQSVGYAERDIPDLIIENNIYGLDIDERACQLAYFALMMKARAYNRRFFRRENVPQPQVYAPQGYEDGMEYGSLVKVEELEEKPLPKEAYSLFDTPYEVELNTWNFRRLLYQKYDVAVTNPPYMGSSGMGAKLSEYVKKHYPDSKADLFAVFIEKCEEMLNGDGYQAMITMHSWMFIATYEMLREKLQHSQFINMIHLGARAFDEIGGEVVQTTAFIRRNVDKVAYKGTYIRLIDYKSSQEKEDAFFSRRNRFVIAQEYFSLVPRTPFVYWANPNAVKLFATTPIIRNNFTTRNGLTTGDNARFLRLWFEVNDNSNSKWFPCNKGGPFRKWYGNQEYCINWENEGSELKNFYGENGKLRSTLRSIDFNFKPCIVVAHVASGDLAYRIVEQGSISESAVNSIYEISNNVDLLYALAALNSKPCNYIIGLFNPTLGISPEDINNLPLVLSAGKAVIQEKAELCISISRTDWDSFETSRDFQTHPLIMAAPLSPQKIAEEQNAGFIVQNTMEDAYRHWKWFADDRFTTLKANEEELNRIFIDIYGLQAELTPEVEDKDVTVRRADLGREIRSFISYAVGCMFGRYSLDTPGLAYAGGEWDEGKYTSYLPEDDNILPITDADYFDDDIVMRFVDFVKVVYGEATLAENLAFIATALYPNGNGTAREMIRRYFQNDFFKDHCKIYQKRPIYWLFDSGKQNGFKALIYLHRYDKYTVARVRTAYLHPLQRKYEAEIERMSKLADLPETSARDKAEFKKQTEKLNKQIAECRTYDQIIAHMAAQTIELDLDDGVKVNYEKFQGVEVPRGDGKGKIKMDLLGRI